MAALARFTTPDPLDGVDGMVTAANVYHYADNDPVNRSDPTGLRPTDEGMGSCAPVTHIAAIDNFFCDHGETVISIAGGVAAGGLCTAATFAVNPGLAFAAGGFCGGAAQQMFDNIMNGRPVFDDVIDPGRIAIDIGLGLGLGYGAMGLGRIIRGPSGLGGVADDLDGIAGVGDDLDGVAGIGDDLDGVAGIGDDFDDVGGIVDDVHSGGGGGVGDDLPAYCSFSADTEVVMADGTTTPIAEIDQGDQVLATDPHTGRTGPRSVAATLPHTDQLLTLDTTAGGIVTTEDHRYWNATDHEWQEAQDLDTGDRLFTADGDTVRVQGLDWTTLHTDTAYDLTITDLHTFYVGTGNDAVLVHNCSSARESEILRDAASGTGNFGLGSATRAEARSAGESWVGAGYRIASDGSSLVSADGLRVFRGPTLKPALGRVQANFEWRSVPRGPMQGNGHLDIIGDEG